MFRLEKLELNGFKSFSSPAEFTFGPGITAVVGPNGCGKSNIADAITWVIGEQSTRILRAEHMGDVIFNGSDARRPMGMAEVSLRLAGHLDPVFPHPRPDSGGNGGSDPSEESAAVVDGVDAGAASGIEGGAAAGNGHGDGNGFGLPEAAAGRAPERREIVITRRLFRSGESEYLLDGQKCRLRDIQELLAEIHVGSGVYTVIEQGRVDAILTSRPRDRRVLIEEAAGIALYKIRKRQAQTKLDAAEANLLRINDIVSEIEKHVGSLKRQAGRARRYARITAAIEKGERILFHHESLQIAAEAERLRARRIEVEMEEAAAAAGIGGAEARLAAAREAAAEEAARHQGAREALHALDRSLDQLKAVLDRFREQESEAASHLARGAAEEESLRERLAGLLDRSRVQAGEAAAALEASARAEAAVAEHEANLRLGAAALQATVASLGAAREETVSAAGALSECRNEIRRLEEAAARAGSEEARLVRLAAEVAAEAEDLDGRRREHEAGQEALASSEMQIRSGAEEAARRLLDAESRRESLLLEREERRGRLKAIEERFAGLKGFEAGSAGVLAHGGTGSPLRLLKDFLAPPERLDRAVDAALNGLLRGFLTGTLDEAAGIVASLKERGRGRAVLIPTASSTHPTAVPAPSLPAAGSAAFGGTGFLGTLRDLLDTGEGGGPCLAAILDRVAVAEDLCAGLSLRSSLPGRDIVTLRGDFLSRDGWVEGGAEIPEEAGIMTLKRLLERLALDAEATQGRIAELDAAIGVTESRLAALREEAEGWRRREASFSRQGESLRLQGESLRAEAARLDLRRDAHAGDLSRIREDLAGVEIARGGVASLLAEGLRRHDELQRQAESLAGAVESMRALESRRSAALAEHRAAASAARERRAAIEAEVRHHAEATADLEARLGREGEDRVNWEGRLREARARLEEDARTLADRMAERILAEGAVASAEAALIERRGALPEIEEAVRRARGLLEGARERLHAHDLEEERLAGDRRGLEARVQERGLPSLAAAVADLTGEEMGTDPATVRAEMAAYREKRDAMGAVNLMAVEQFRELEERHAFITAQRRDLEGSIHSLKETIARINRQSRERFMDAFEKIRAGFGDIFKTLFGGGRADLRLVTEGEEEGDLLEAGLEISAQPPGKRLQSISLLSGGEKALTAIALLFAIFRYSPSPFCLLDEVDAPLDEANVMRFAALLRKMSAETQFVMITHNRRSMEAAAMLYGITMEEPGVSRTVSVVIGSEEDRREAAKTLPALLASHHRGASARSRPPGPPAAAGNDA